MHNRFWFWTDFRVIQEYESHMSRAELALDKNAIRMYERNIKEAYEIEEELKRRGLKYKAV